MVTTPDTTSLTEAIPQSIERLTSLELVALGHAQRLEEFKATMKRLEYGFIRGGIQGANETTRQAWLALALEESSEYQEVALRARQEKEGLDHAKIMVEASRHLLEFQIALLKAQR